MSAKSDIFRFISMVLLLLFTSFMTYAQSPQGYWKTYDLDHRPRSIIKITERNHQLVGVIETLLPPQTNQSRCIHCTGQRHNKLLKGMLIIWGLQKENNHWGDGYVLNTDDGNIYRCEISLSPDNKIMYFSAYVGMPMFGKTVRWKRVS